MLTHIDLFAGIMGFSLGFERAGIETVAYVEIDKTCQSVIRRHKPNALLIADVRDAGAHNLPHADIISFGSPCQDLSVAGARKGLVGERSGLFYEAVRIIRELKPTFAIWENVPGAFSSHAGRDFYHVLRAFHECGARDIAWATLDAQHFGVPQRRRRVFVVADFGGERAGEILFVPESRTGHPEPRQQAGQGTAATVSASPPSRRNGGSDPTAGHFVYAEQRSDQYADASVASTLASRDGKGVRTVVAGTLGAEFGRNRSLGNANEADFLVAEAIDVCNSRSNGGISGTLQSKANGGYSLNYQNPIAVHAIDLQQVTSAVNRSVPTSESPPLTTGQDIVVFTQNEREEVRDLGDKAGALASEPGTHQQNYIAFMGGQGAKAGSIAASETTAPTLKGVGSGTNQIPAISASFGVRRLTPTECARLQGFPDDWAAYDADGKALSDSAQYRMYGNAVAVPVIEWLGRRIMALDTHDAHAAGEETP